MSNDCSISSIVSGNKNTFKELTSIVKLVSKCTTFSTRCSKVTLNVDVLSSLNKRNIFFINNSSRTCNSQNWFINNLNFTSNSINLLVTNIQITICVKTRVEYNTSTATL